MTRFDAADPEGRRKLVADAILAHRERESQFLTVQAATPPEPDREDGPPWVQYADGTLNLDCTDEERQRLETLLESFPSFRIDDRASPEDAMGTNLRLTARSDANRVAQFVDRVFLDAYGMAEEYRLWVVEV